MPRLSTPRIVPTPSVMSLPGMKVPGGANTPFMPVRAFGAPHTTCTGSPAPVSTMQTRSRSAFGCCSRLDHARDRESGEAPSPCPDALDLEPDARQRLDDRVERGLGVEVVFQPGEGEFHGALSAYRVSRIKKQEDRAIDARLHRAVQRRNPSPHT